MGKRVKANKGDFIPDGEIEALGKKYGCDAMVVLAYKEGDGTTVTVGGTNKDNLTHIVDALKQTAQHLMLHRIQEIMDKMSKMTKSPKKAKKGKKK